MALYRPIPSSSGAKVYKVAEYTTTNAKTINISNLVPNYQNLTAANILVVGTSWYGSTPGTGSSIINYVATYNPSTGVISIPTSLAGATSFACNHTEVYVIDGTVTDLT